MDVNLRNPTRHEAGHVVIGLHLGFIVESVEVVGGKFVNVCQLNDPNRTNEERYLYLAGGIAAEQLEFNRYDREASENDQKLISELGGGKIESYICAATEIIRTHEACFRTFWQRITIRLQEKLMAMIVTRGSNSFKLLSSAEIQEIWLACNQ